MKLYRKISDNQLWLSEPFTRGQAWVDLVMIAQHKPGAIRKRGIIIKLPVGSIGYSQIALAERWKWSRGKVIRFLKELETEQQIVQQKSRVTTLIHIVNYKEYQQGSTTDSTTNSTTNGQQTVQEQALKNESIKALKKNNNKIDLEKFRPDNITKELWSALIENRKFKKLQNTELALKTICNSFQKGVNAGYSIDECIGNFVSSKWTRFNHEWINGSNNGKSKQTNSGSNGYVEAGSKDYRA